MEICIGQVKFNLICQKILQAGYPLKFIINNVIHQFQESCKQKDNNDEYLIPSFFIRRTERNH